MIISVCDADAYGKSGAELVPGLALKLSFTNCDVCESYRYLAVTQLYYKAYTIFGFLTTRATERFLP